MGQNSNLKFALLIRVSTEKQAKKGESLKTQKADLQADVDSLGGEVYRSYEGQEHATPDYERRILDELIRSAKGKEFDAVMIWHIDRWSRDNLRSEQDLKILRDNGIRFFVRTKEYDLFNPSEYMFIALYVLMGQVQAIEQSRKSILNRINRARQGIPSCGKKPYGRRFNRKTGEWEIDKEAQNKIRAIAKLYLEQDFNYQELGKRFGMNPTNLHKILNYRCGDSWQQRFMSKKLNVDEAVTTKIPRLLPEEMILEIRRKCKARKTWDHKSQKNSYLLARMIFDMESGYSLSGTTNQKGVRYYKPHLGNADRYQVNADVIEKAIMNSLIESLSCKESLRAAVFDGNPMSTVADRLKRDLDLKRKELKSSERKLNNLLRIIENLEDGQIDNFSRTYRARIAELEREIAGLKNEISRVEYQLSSLPSDKEIENKREWFRNQLLRTQREHYLASGAALERLSFDERKKVCQLFFGGEDESGKRYGIYIKKLEGKPRRYKFEAYGRLGIVSGWQEARTRKNSTYSSLEWLRNDDKELSGRIANVLLDSNPDLIHENAKVIEHTLSERHAHHGFRLHQ